MSLYAILHIDETINGKQIVIDVTEDKSPYEYNAVYIIIDITNHPQRENIVRYKWAYDKETDTFVEIPIYYFITLDCDNIVIGVIKSNYEPNADNIVVISEEQYIKHENGYLTLIGKEYDSADGKFYNVFQRIAQLREMLKA